MLLLRKIASCCLETVAQRSTERPKFRNAICQDAFVKMSPRLFYVDESVLMAAMLCADRGFKLSVERVKCAKVRSSTLGTVTPVSRNVIST